MNATQEKICAINAVEGFDPAALAVDYTDLNTGEGYEICRGQISPRPPLGGHRKRLPVMAQVAWFRLKYPEGRIAIAVQSVKDYFIATARVYRSYNDPADNFLAEASTSRGYIADKPTISPREWAQTAAVGIALRNAGFGLQFHACGESFDAPAVDELAENPLPVAASKPELVPKSAPEPESLTYESALLLPCPIAKYKGKTLGDLITLDPGALTWIATKFTGDPQLIGGAKLICEQAVQQAV
jgi:hypothetical protein